MSNEIVIYQIDKLTEQLEVRVENETVWLSRLQIALLFDRDVKTIGKHIGNVLKEELAVFQLSQNLRQLPLMVKPIKPNTTTSI